jgi:hypothetical protein
MGVATVPVLNMKSTSGAVPPVVSKMAPFSAFRFRNLKTVGPNVSPSWRRTNSKLDFIVPLVALPIEMSPAVPVVGLTALFTRSLSTLFVLKTKSVASVVPTKFVAALVVEFPVIDQLLLLVFNLSQMVPLKNKNQHL